MAENVLSTNWQENCCRGFVSNSTLLKHYSLIPFMNVISLLSLATLLGFSHAFEADHLAAMSNLVTKRKVLWLAIKDAAFWGFGHTSTIILVGILMILGHFAIPDSTFQYLEAGVGLMLILLGFIRLVKWIKYQKLPDTTNIIYDSHHHHEAYGIGLVHGLAGSGSIVLLVMLDIKEPVWSLMYLLLFGLGSVAGMIFATVAFGFPFFRSSSYQEKIQVVLMLVSSLLCLSIGLKILYDTMYN